KLLSVLCIIGLVGAFAVYYLRGAILNGEGRGLPPKPFAHLSLMGGLAVAAFALHFWVARFQLLLSKRGAVFGAGYTDVHAHAGAHLLLLIAGLILGGWLIVNARWQRRPGNLYALAAFGLLWIAAGHVYPWGVQQFMVRPNEWDYEKDYIARNIEFTRIAYGLDEVKAQAWPGDGALTAEALAAHAGTTDNLQVWDPAPLQSMFNQKQRIRSYYAFNPVDVDRYEVDGALRPVMIAPRELGVDGLPEKNRVWTNLHLYYTHGYGLCMSFANRAVAGGLPDFLIRDIPPVSMRAPEVAEPRIYFGENTTDYALVDTDLDEFDYPGDPENFFNRYVG
ncbi:MAG: COG1615 family transporter, partial [bacterium]|nr:COG1615 family transporter [bacterium]